MHARVGQGSATPEAERNAAKPRTENVHVRLQGLDPPSEEVAADGLG